MRRAKVLVNGTEAGILEKTGQGEEYIFRYREDYRGDPISLTMPTEKREYRFNHFPPFFDGVLPEGAMLEALLRGKKIDRKDFFSQLVAVGQDLIGSVTVEEIS